MYGENYSIRLHTPSGGISTLQSSRPCQLSRRLGGAIDHSTTIDIRLACVSMARRVRNDDYSSATYRG
jgi:hypothetical protein